MNEQQPLEKELRLFTRFPTPGKTKTRLIPEVGAEKAADLQRRMTELITRRMCELDRSNTRLTVSYSDASAADMKQWLTPICNKLQFDAQSGTDLGDRLKNAFRDSFDAGHRRTIIIGADCPDITKSIITSAFQQLKTHDAVIGPAQDGGYYLIGLSSLEEQLFSNIDWGSDSVFAQTMVKAQSKDLRVKTLDKLRDIDRPEDLDYLPGDELPD